MPNHKNSARMATPEEINWARTKVPEKINRFNQAEPAKSNATAKEEIISCSLRGSREVRRNADSLIRSHSAINSHTGNTDPKMRSTRSNKTKANSSGNWKVEAQPKNKQPSSTSKPGMCHQSDLDLELDLKLIDESVLYNFYFSSPEI